MAKPAVDRSIYPFRTMKIGEEFFVPGADRSFRCYVYHRASFLGRRFKFRMEERRGIKGAVVERVSL
jgi:hypothetical protein